MAEVRIFVLYHKPSLIYDTGCLRPLQTGCAQANTDIGILRDDTGDNISYKNEKYAELTGNYWVWKNYLSSHPDLQYVGFCHYRRFLDFWHDPRSYVFPFETQFSYDRFYRTWLDKYTEKHVLQAIQGYDIILPRVWCSGQLGLTNYEYYLKCGHPKEYFDIFCDVIRMRCPEYREDLDHFIAGDTAWYCLTYVMRRNLFVSFMEWLFPILFEMEQKTELKSGNGYNESKIPAFLAERFFNVWLLHKQRVDAVRILECDGILLKDIGTTSFAITVRAVGLRICRTVKYIFDGSFISRMRRIVRERNLVRKRCQMLRSSK